MNFLESLVGEAKKKKKQIETGVRDVFDANTAADQQRRVQVGQARDYQTQQRQIGNPGIARKVGTGLGLGAVRSVTGLGQGVSGLYDLATPGHGTNRLSNTLDHFAKFTDNTAQNEGIWKPGYQGGQLASDALGFLVGGGEIKYGLKGVEAAPKVAKFVKPIIRDTEAAHNATVNPLARLEAKGIGGRIAAKTARGTIDPGNNAANLLMTAKLTGEQASKGRDVSAGSVAKNLALGTAFNAGIPLASAVGHEGIQAGSRAIVKSGKATTKAAVKANQAVNKSLTPKEFKISPEDHSALTDFHNMMSSRHLPDQGGYTPGDVSALINRARQVGQQTGLDVTTGAPADVAGRVEQYLNDFKNHQDSVLQGGYAKLPGGAKDPASDLHPKQKEFINDYSEMIRKLGEGNGVDITHDGRRVSNNVRMGDTKGKNMTVRDWFDEARRQLETGDTVDGSHQMYREIPSKADDPLGIADIEQAMARNETPTPKKQEQPAPIEQDLQAAGIAPKVTTNRLTQQANRQNLSPEAQKLVSGEHTVRNTQELSDQALADANKLSTNDLINVTNERLAVKTGSIDDSDVALANHAIERAEAEGRTQDAVAIHDSLSEHLVKAGQTAQAASLLYRLSPNGILYKGLRDIKKALPKDQKVSPEVESKLRTATEKIRAATDQKSKERATAEFHKIVADNIPKSKLKGVLSVWKAGLLSGTKTIAGNPLSNEVFYGLKQTSDPFSVVFDKGLKLAGKTKAGKKLGLTGERTYTTSAKGTISGTKEGLGGAKDTLRTGIDRRDMGLDGKYETYGEINFKNKVMQNVFGKPSNLVFRTMSAADQPVYYRTLQQELGRQAKVQAMNKGLRGAERKAYIENAYKNPTMEMAQTARDAAEKSVLTNHTKVGSAVSQFVGKVPVLQAVVPFTKVPTNFLSRSLDYSPVGAIKGIVKEANNLRNGKGIDQRALSQALGEATTGTAVIFVGAALANNNLLSGQYPQNDPKEAQRWKTEGITPNSVKIGDKWVSLNYLGPAGLLLGAGKDYHEAIAQGDSKQAAAIASAAGAGKNLSGQSFLSGFSGLTNAVNDPQRSAKSYVNSQASSVVPSWLNDIANITDSKQRQADTTKEAVKNRIPVVRHDNKVKQDVYGNELVQPAGQANSINPLKPSKDLSKKNDVVTEVSRLHNLDANNKDLQVTPTAEDKTIKIGGQNIKLNNDQRYALQKQIGKATQEEWGKIIKTSEYKAGTDTEKADMLTSARTKISEAQRANYAISNNLVSSDKAKLTSVQKKYLSGQNVDWLTKSSDKTYADKYIDATADYKKNSASWSSVKKSNKENQLLKLSVQKDYDEDTVGLHGMSKTRAYELLSTDKNGNALAKKLLAYDDALTAAGLQAKNKFRDKNGNEAIKPKTSGSGGKSGGGGGKGKSIATLISEFKLPFDDEIKNRTKGAQLARSAGLARRS